MKKTESFKPKITTDKDGTKTVSVEDCIFFTEDFAKLPKGAIIIISKGEIMVPGRKTQCKKAQKK